MVHPTTFQFDDEIFYAFRKKCNDEGVTMKERIQNFMRESIKPKPKLDEKNLEIFKHIEENIQKMTQDELKENNQKLIELYSATTDPAIRTQIKVYAAKIKTEYDKTKEDTT